MSHSLCNIREEIRDDIDDLLQEEYHLRCVDLRVGGREHLVPVQFLQTPEVVPAYAYVAEETVLKHKIENVFKSAASEADDLPDGWMTL